MLLAVDTLLDHISLKQRSCMGLSNQTIRQCRILVFVMRFFLTQSWASRQERELGQTREN